MNENDLIKQKDAEIDILIRKNERLKDEVSELRAEVERLTAMVDAAEDYLNPLPFKNAYDVAIETAKSEARKELAERLKKKLAYKGKSTKYGDFTWGDIKSYELDNLLAEMESERE